MTQAAKRLDISEPALSQQLKKIERRIQSHLFERGNGGLVTTASGRVFVAHAVEIVQEFRNSGVPFRKRTKPSTTKRTN